MEMIKSQVSSCFERGNVFPPGFRFHPTDEELVSYYLKKKICRRPHLVDVIAETDVYKWEPEDLPEISKLKTGDRQWFFFSPRERKYPKGVQSKRATMHGYWKATGKDRVIKCNSRAVGHKKTLIFYHGRAPKAGRTDWVMHEYTMNEEELSRCLDAKDYYVLYKVYKKSGPGPKNGEQYGAPFREEDWSDDEIDASGPSRVEDIGKQFEEGVPSIDSRVNCQLKSQLDGLEEFWSRIADEPLPASAPPVNFGFSLDDLDYEVEAPANLVDETATEKALTVQCSKLQPAYHQQNAPASFDLTQTGASQLLLHEAPEVASVAKNPVPEPHLVEEDFLEMYDLTGSKPMGQVSDSHTQAVENQQLDEFEGLGEFDLYGDVLTVFCGSETGDQGLISQYYTNNLENEAINPVPNFDVNNFEARTEMYGQTYLHDGNDSSFLHWTHDQRHSVYTPGAANQGTLSPAVPGVLYDGNATKHHTGAAQNNSGKQGNGTDQWLSSALWSFVESIPTTPASAAEGALVNRAVERMSSFSRVRINSKSSNVAAGLGKCTNGFFIFSVVGAVCAILWMLIGISMRVLGRCMSSA